ncbi:putative quinol monooxygenase [Pantoea coffeiphila]|uniref:Antibiotic biosynthesis monooxygenase n=1 Tax=Pantoea coffeiphila TaxID=1465635 RepID=A0A2S9IC74_9GAMM|nr:antibiotic biosynthesis monooxygenase [Pantoea coffeiphila]PRD15387.1 antibiotic biosynthesis monooxygenase [Pantoea coffeiphila]
MISITALIEVKPGYERVMLDALLEVADWVKAHEPTTRGFYISQDSHNACLFTTYERFDDRAAMDRHNSSAAVSRFFDIARPILAGEVTLVTANEVSAK